VKARLDLFAQVADAVHAAHRQLVVHRDIKPSNILVSADGTVKLLDFGIAKLLEEEADQTQDGAHPLTPDYASPEQIRGGRITTATDIYQLGLLLTELLTGIRPAAGLPHAALPQRVSRLANRAWTNAPDAAARAAARATTTTRLVRELTGDLDVIVAKALRPEPEERYASADELASDVRRHLGGRPIAAYPESRAYRFRKLVRRNPWTAAAAGVAVVALVGYASTVTMQSRRIAAERDRAAQEAAKASEVTDFLVQLFQSADPNESRGATVTARELLDRGVQDLEHRLRDEPATRAAMLSAIGRSYHQLALYRQARTVLEQAVAERRDVTPVARRELASDLSGLARIVWRTDPDSGLRLFAQALDLAEKAAGKSDALVGTILTGYGVALARTQHGDPRADSLLARAVAILRSAPGDNRGALAQAINAAAYGKDPEVALPLMREGLAITRSMHGDVHAAIATSLSDLALATEAVDPLAADTLMEQALAISEKLHGKRHALTLTMMNNLAGLRRDRSAWAEAAPLYREVLALRRELYPDEVRGHAYALYGLGLTMAESGDPRVAEGHLREALRILEASERPGSVLLSLTRAAIGYALARQQRFGEAEPLMVESARALQETSLSTVEHTRLLERVISMYQSWGRSDQAAGYQERLDQLLVAERSGHGSGK
jgi:serine/threonine-protein kinase